MPAGASEPRPPRLVPPGFRVVLRDHLGMCASAGISLLVSLKLLASAGYDVNTASAIVQVAGTPQILLGTLVSILPSLTAALLLVLVTRYWRWYWSRTSVERSAIGLAVTLPGLFVLSMTPLSVAIAVVLSLVLLFIAGACLALVQKRARRRGRVEGVSEAEESISNTERKAVSAAGFAGVVVIALQSPWLPTEAITVAGEAPITAYVVGERGEDTVLLEKGRGKGLRVVPTLEVERSLCSSRSVWSQNIGSLVGGVKSAHCPEP